MSLTFWFGYTIGSIFFALTMLNYDKIIVRKIDDTIKRYMKEMKEKLEELKIMVKK